jgi:putative transposase
MIARHIVRQIFVDENLLKIDDQDYWLWIVSYEPNLNTYLMIHLSRERTIFVCYYRFLRLLRNRYGSRKPIYTDGARWYDDDRKWLRLKQDVYDTKLKNTIERFVQQIKDRTECFDDDHFLCTKQDCNRQHVWNWLKLFILYLHIGTNRIQFITFLVIEEWLS